MELSKWKTHFIFSFLYAEQLNSTYNWCHASYLVNKELLFETLNLHFFNSGMVGVDEAHVEVNEISMEMEDQRLGMSLSKSYFVWDNY